MKRSRLSSSAPGVESPPHRLSTGTHLAYGASAFAENLAINSVNQVASPVFNLALGVSPIMVGAALALPRLLDAFTDPWIGTVSDKWRSRWGRRRPFIVGGALLTALSFVAIWLFPSGQSPAFYFSWLAAGSSLLAIAYSIFVVPYGALGLELTRDYHERTRLMGTKSMFHKASGVVNQWLLKVMLLAGGGSLVLGSRISGGAVALLVLALGLATGFVVKEPPSGLVHAPKLSVWAGWRAATRRTDFLRLIAAQILVYASYLVIDTTGFYLNVFYVNNGDMLAGAVMKGAAGTCFHLSGLLAIPAIVRLSGRVGKKRAFLICTATLVFAGLAKWFCFFPGAGWLLVIPSLFLGPGLAAVMVLVPSMTADICDLDERTTGARREGMFNAVLGWSTKLALSGSIFVAGVVLDLTGWQTDAMAAQSPRTYLTMRIAFAAGTVILAAAAAVVIAGYKGRERSASRPQGAFDDFDQLSAMRSRR